MWFSSRGRLGEVGERIVGALGADHEVVRVLAAVVELDRLEARGKDRARERQRVLARGDRDGVVLGRGRRSASRAACRHRAPESRGRRGPPGPEPPKSRPAATGAEGDRARAPAHAFALTRLAAASSPRTSSPPIDFFAPRACDGRARRSRRRTSRPSNASERPRPPGMPARGSLHQRVAGEAGGAGDDRARRRRSATARAASSRRRGSRRSRAGCPGCRGRRPCRRRGRGTRRPSCPWPASRPAARGRRRRGRCPSRSPAHGGRTRSRR